MKWVLLMVWSLSFGAETVAVIGKHVVFDFEGHRQLAVIGTKPQEQNGALMTSASWHVAGKLGKSSRVERVNLRSSSTVIQSEFLNHTVHGKAVTLKPETVILGNNGKVYAIVAVFPNGELGLREFDLKAGTLKPHIETVVKDKSFVAAVEKSCIGNICSGAAVSGSDPYRMCRIQPANYYKNNDLLENRADTVECNKMQTPRPDKVVKVFSNGQLLLGAGGLYYDSEAQRPFEPSAVEQ